MENKLSIFGSAILVLDGNDKFFALICWQANPKRFKFPV